MGVAGLNGHSMAGSSCGATCKETNLNSSVVFLFSGVSIKKLKVNQIFCKWHCRDPAASMVAEVSRSLAG